MFKQNIGPVPHLRELLLLPFQKTVGVNFSTYLEQVRMTQAKHLLETTNIKITDLYVAVGYNNLTSFRRAFKKKYGVAPNAIRE